MTSFHSKKGAFFFKYFSIFSAIVLVGLIIVGTALMIFVSAYLKGQNLDKTSYDAEELSLMITELIDSDTPESNPEAAVFVILKNMEVMARSSGSDIFICNTEGNVSACCHMLKGFKLNDTKCEKHRDFVLSKALLQKAQKSGSSDFSNLNGFYDSVHSVSVEPISGGKQDIIGFVIVASPISDNLVGSLKTILKLFIFAAALSLVLITIAVYLMTEKIAKPIRNLENATRCYTSGDFSYRVPELNSSDELAGLITKFNAMASALAQLEGSRRSFVANVSHEFKSPMTTIRGFIDGILDGTIPQERQHYYLEIVVSEINRLSGMVDMMLNISNIESGNVNMTYEDVFLSERIVSVFLGFEQLISNKKIEVEGFNALESTSIRADGPMIDRVIYNLVDNAVKFTNEGGKISVETHSDKKFAYFTITNTGKGIPKKDLRRIFERFYKVDQSRSTDVKNTGLGLFLVRSIVDLHGGTITVESEPDNYTKFTVKLPK